MSGEDRKTAPKPAEPLVRDANEDTGLDLFAKPGGNLFGEDSCPSLLLIDLAETDAASAPSLRETDTPLDPDSVAMFGK